MMLLAWAYCPFSIKIQALGQRGQVEKMANYVEIPGHDWPRLRHHLGSLETLKQVIVILYIFS